MRTIFCLGLVALMVACGGGDDPPASNSGGAGAPTAGSGGGGGAVAGGGSGSGGSDTAGAGQGGEAGGNQPPSWTAPSEIQVREGETFSVAFAPSDPDGDEVQATVGGADGWTARIEGGELHVLGRFDGADSSVLTVDLSDGKGGTTQVSVKVTVARRSWGESLNLKTQGVEAREHPALIFDDAKKRVLVLGGSGYNPYGTPLGDMHAVALADGAVSELKGQGDVPPPGASRRVAMVPGKSEAYLFGGYGEADSNDLWHVDFSGDEPVFSLMTQAKPPSARELHLFARDAGTGAFFVFGGVSQLGAISKDLFKGELLDGVVTWKKLNITGDKPSGRYGFFYGVDAQRGQVLLFSGAQGLSPLNPARDLWRLDLRSDPPSWTLLLEGEAVPEGRRNGAVAYDDVNDLLYVWGGTPDAQNSAPGLWVYDARPGIDGWFEVKRAGEPPIRSSGVGFVDSEGKLRLGFGNTTKAVYSDLTVLGF